MMRPHLALRIAGSTAHAHKNGPVRLTFSTCSHSASGIWSNGRISSVENIPALLIKTSTPPNSSVASSTISLIEASSATSVVIANAWPPACMTSCDTAAAFSSLRSAMTTRAPARPNALAKTRPMP